MLKRQIEGTQVGAALKEFFANSGHFFVLKSLSDITLDGWVAYLTHPPEYLLIVGTVVQAWYLSRAIAQRFWGNLIGVSIYTLLDFPLDGWDFFSDSSHVIFWAASLAIALCQGLRFHHWKSAEMWIIPIESVIRSLMLPAFYLVVRGGEKPSSTVNGWLHVPDMVQLATRSSGIFLVTSIMMVGLLLGLQIRYITQQQQQLQKTAHLLNNLANWGIGRHVVDIAVANPQALALHSCDRTVLFMDIRGFTSWCERSAPNHVAQTLNQYYQTVEPEAASQQPIRISITADEIMAVYATPEQGVLAAQRMQQRVTPILQQAGLGAGCAVHCGTVIEGLFGSDEVRTYTVIGDVVNTAKRMEGQTSAQHITLSDRVYQQVQSWVQVEPLAPMDVKGKSQPLVVWSLLPMDSNPATQNR